MQMHYDKFNIININDIEREFKNAGVRSELVSNALSSMVRVMYEFEKDANYKLGGPMKDYMAKSLKLNERQMNVIYQRAKKLHSEYVANKN